MSKELTEALNALEGCAGTLRSLQGTTSDALIAEILGVCEKEIKDWDGYTPNEYFRGKMLMADTIKTMIENFKKE